ncbi:MAG: hypothetical protein JXA09_03445 [Anaerolineae bacterium]|nr:hypothetical protein [Anaerolineae bacterium]
MTSDDRVPEDGQVRVNLAVQVASIAAQVTAALRSGDQETKHKLRNTLLKAQLQLRAGPAPEGLISFIDVMRGMLVGEDVSTIVPPLPDAYRAVVAQMIGEIEHDDEVSLTLRDVLDEVTHNVTVAMRHGSYAQRRLMANTLLRMERESEQRPDLAGLVSFLEAARALLQEEDWTQAASALRGPFQAQWEDLLELLRVTLPPTDEDEA